MTATGCSSGFTKGAFSALADGTEPLAMVYPAHYVKSKINYLTVLGRGRVLMSFRLSLFNCIGM